MEKKIYIIFTCSLVPIGGAQLYTAGKTRYLEELGWHIVIFNEGKSDLNCAFSALNKYNKVGSDCDFLTEPPYKSKRNEQEYILNLLVQKIIYSIGEGGDTNLKNYEIIIESHSHNRAYWAELLAERIGARHFFLAVNENYRSNYSTGLMKTYQDNLDFFYFKWQRNELICRDVGCKALFNGYKNVTALKYEMPFSTPEMQPIQDVENFPVEQIQRLDWNICHVGRVVKDYVPAVIKGVGELARRYPDKKINFIFVGNAEPRRDLITQTFDGVDNVLITNLGDMVPIPRNLFSRVDVVCAIAQTSNFCANEGVLTICGTASVPEKSSGVLGYDTKERTFGDPKFSYVEILENVLVKKLYVGKKYGMEKILPAEHYYEKFWTIVKNADPKKEYFTERLRQERIKNWIAIFPFVAVSRDARIVLVGETEIAKDFRAQIYSQTNWTTEFGRGYTKQLNPAPYCEIVATVDENPDEFDDSVEGFERLKTLDYDVMILCIRRRDIPATKEKILKIVPEMKDKFIYNFQIIRV